MANESSTGDTALDDVEKRVRQWLLEEGWQLDAESRPDYKFAIVADDGSGRKLIVSQQSQKADRITIEASVSLSDDHVKKMEKLQQKKRRDFLWDLRFELLQTDVEFTGVGESLQRVVVGQPIFYDALSKDVFMQRVSEVKKALLLVLWKVAQLMEESPSQMGFLKG